MRRYESQTSALAADQKYDAGSLPARKGQAARQVLENRISTEGAKHPTRPINNLFEGQASPHARMMESEIRRVARRSYNILITGETGTGKTYVAREIHQHSVRAKGPFMELNCGNLPEQLVEAELFGYRKGAFTGADRDHVGLFEEASSGILFLDEIGDIPPVVQNKLLRAIEEKQIKRLGTNHYTFCDVQIIAATSRNLPEMIQRGEFREDLYSRLAVLTIETVPLRERREDIPVMIAFYLREAAGVVTWKAQQLGTYPIDDGALALLCECDYPGNIRALRNLIYELTSYVDENEPISIELVQFVLARLSSRGSIYVTSRNRPVAHSHFGDELTSAREITSLDAAAKHSLLRSIAHEGDIVLPLELCVLRSGETFKQWTARAKRCSIEAARQAMGGTMQSAAQRLGLSRSSLRSHLQRARRAQKETLFDWQGDPDSKSSDR